MPFGPEHHVDAVQTARKEYHYKRMDSDTRALFDEAAIAGWKVYIDNDAIEVLDRPTSDKIRRELAAKGQLDSILRPRFVMTDKNDGLRTETHQLLLKASARLVVPGFKDGANLQNKIRRDAPTGSRIAQHLLFTVAAVNPEWLICSADVKAAFMKGDPYLDRMLYMSGTDDRSGPAIPIPYGCLARIKKGVFGLADAPREWWLRLSRCLAEHGWERSQIDNAMWMRWQSGSAPGSERVLTGIIVAHVDDLLMTGNAEAEASLLRVGDELGFGSLEKTDFVWCGKRIRRHSDGTIRLSMTEYHQNLKEAIIPAHRKRDLDAPLTDY